MSEFSSGKNARLAWANGSVIQYCITDDWEDLRGSHCLSIFERVDIKFRLKPRAIKVNGIEVKFDSASVQHGVFTFEISNKEDEHKLINTLMGHKL